MLGKYNTLRSAKFAQDHSAKITFIILGDDGLFWLVTPATMERMVKAGYELA